MTDSVEINFSRGNATTKECIDKGYETFYRHQAGYNKKIRNPNVSDTSIALLGQTVSYNANHNEKGIAAKHTYSRQSMTCNTDISRDHPCANLTTPGAYYSSCQ